MGVIERKPSEFKFSSKSEERLSELKLNVLVIKPT
jgi:hypothetical protein